MLKEFDLKYKVYSFRYQRDTLHSNVKIRYQEKDKLTKQVEYYKNKIELLEAWNKEFQNENENQKSIIERQKRDIDKSLDVLEKTLASDKIEQVWTGRLAEKSKSWRNVNLTAPI